MSQSHWGADGVHNCTNYAAWQLMQNGTPYPGFNLGNANTCEDRAASRGIPVDTSPGIRAISQWDSGDYGHVAYVREVGQRHIVIAEDAWADGTFDLRRIESA